MTQPKWLFMLYLSGDNNLSSEMIWALKDIEDQGLPDGFDMTILYHALSPFSPTFVYDLSGQSENGPGGAVETNPAVIAPLPLPRMKDAKPKLYEWVEDSSNPETLRKFIEWSVFGRSLGFHAPHVDPVRARQRRRWGLPTRQPLGERAAWLVDYPGA